jgi:hypothetical protein
MSSVLEQILQMQPEPRKPQTMKNIIETLEENLGAIMYHHTQDIHGLEHILNYHNAPVQVIDSITQYMCTSPVIDEIREQKQALEQLRRMIGLSRGKSLTQLKYNAAQKAKQEVIKMQSFASKPKCQCPFYTMTPEELAFYATSFMAMPHHTSPASGSTVEGTTDATSVASADVTTDVPPPVPPRPTVKSDGQTVKSDTLNATSKGNLIQEMLSKTDSSDEEDNVESDEDSDDYADMPPLESPGGTQYYNDTPINVPSFEEWCNVNYPGNVEDEEAERTITDGRPVAYIPIKTEEFVNHSFKDGDNDMENVD